MICLICIISVTCCSKNNLPATPELPRMIAGMKLERTLSGVKANKFVFRMHGRATGVRNSIIGYYDETERNVLYVSSFETDELAQAALQKMASKMAGATMGFEPARREESENGLVYRTEGMGLSHFFFRQDSFVIWWHSAPDKAEASSGFLLSYQFK